MRLRLALLALALSGTLDTAAFAQTAQTAQPGDVAGERRLVVIGQGTVRGRPDMAIVSVGVVTEAERAREALSANTQAMNRILEALRAEGIESRDLQTSGFSVEPRNSQPPPDWNGSDPFTLKIIGYSVRNNIALRVRELDRVGALLDQVISLGANSISGPSFAVSDPSALEDQARQAAVRDARHKAELYAGAAAIELGPILRVEEIATQSPQPLPMGAMAREAAADAAVPVEGGELSVQAEVSVTWGIGQ